jgi:hypothetical protein
MRPIHEIAAEVIAVWRKLGKGVNYAAVPYLDAMLSLSDISEAYGDDSGRSVVAYGLSNMTGFRGADARRLKAELKAHLG